MESKIFRYKIIPELNLIIEFWQGEFNFMEILEFKNIESADPDWRDHYDVLADDRYSKKALKSIVENTSKEDKEKILKQSEKYIKKRKSALLTKSPQQVATSVLLRNNKNEKAMVQLEVFSTIEGALTWLNIKPEEFDRIKSIIHQLASE